MAYMIFLSHSGIDNSLAKWIFTDANKVGVGVYLFEHDSQPGRLLATKVQKAIRGSDAVVALLTRNGQSSPYVQQEIGFADACGKLIVPIVERGVDTRSLAMLTGREYIPFDPDNPIAALKTLLQYLVARKSGKEHNQAIFVVAGFLLFAAVVVSSNK